MNSKRALSIVVIMSCLAGCAYQQPIVPETAQQVAHEAYTGGEFRTTLKHFTAGSAALQEGNIEEAKTSFLEAFETAPEHPALFFQLAMLEAKLGNKDASLSWLQRYADIGAAADLANNETFAGFSEDETFKEILARLGANARPPAKAEIVVTFDDAQLWVEGIAYDPKTGNLFAGSMFRNQIVVIQPDGTVEDFGTSANDDLWPILGMEVDAERRHLWACMGSGSDEMTTQGERRLNGVVKYDLESGHLLARYDLADDGVNRLLNDVCITDDGTAYITESNHGSVYLVSEGSETLEHYRFFPALNYLNGITRSRDSRILYLAAVEGIFAFDLETQKLQTLEHISTLTTVGADGLRVAGSNLIAVQNQPRLGFRVMRFALDDTGLVIRDSEILDTAMPDGLIPYTCAVSEDAVFVNGTGFLELMDSGEIPANPIIIRVPLTRG